MSRRLRTCYACSTVVVEVVEAPRNQAFSQANERASHNIRRALALINQNNTSQKPRSSRQEMMSIGYFERREVLLSMSPLHQELCTPQEVLLSGVFKHCRKSWQVVRSRGLRGRSEGASARTRKWNQRVENCSPFPHPKTFS